MIAYISEVSIPPALRGREINDILESAQHRNKKLGVTSVLFLRGNTFFQTLEGPNDAVRSVFQNIQEDDRHSSLYVLFDEPIEQRRFSDWSIECFHEVSCERDYLDIFHEIGEHFSRGVGFDPHGVYLYCSRLVAALAANRLQVARNGVCPHAD